MKHKAVRRTRRVTLAPRAQLTDMPVGSRRLGRTTRPVMNNLHPPNSGGSSALALDRQLGSMKLGNTSEGTYWAMRALHPCDETRGGGTAIPDQSATQSANLEYRVDSVIATAGDPDINWDCQLLFIPFGELPVVYRRRQIGADWSPWFGLAPNGSFIQPGDLTLGTGDASATPPTWIGPAETSSPSLLKSTTGYRSTYRGVTVILNASSLANEGYVTAGQWESRPDVGESALAELGATPPENASQYKVAVINDVPTDPSQIITKCPETGQWEARKGIYMPLRFPDPAHQYTTPAGTETSNIIADIVVASPIQILPSGSSASTLVRNSNVSNTVHTVSGTVNLNLGTAIFSGLNANASLVIKCRAGMELVPVSDSPMSGFIAEAPLKDGAAIDAVQGIASKLPVVYEARFNSLGAIVPYILKAAKYIIPAVAPWLVGKVRGWLGGKAPAPAPRYIEEPVD